MKFRFVDLSNEKEGEVIVNSKEELNEFLDKVRNRKPFIYELIGDYNYKLTNGISSEVECIQFSDVNDDPPYLMAVTKTKIVESEFEFTMGGTATPIMGKYCLPPKDARAIIWYFIENGDKHPGYTWAEQ